MQKKLQWTCLILFLSAIACRNNTSERTEPTPQDSVDSTPLVDSLLSDKEISAAESIGFSGYMKQADPAFDFHRFTLSQYWAVDSLPGDDFAGTKKYFDAYGPFLIYAPDSSRFVDLDSYNILIQKEKQGRFRGQELGPDTEISLVDLHTKKKRRLLFLGPGGSVDDACWPDNQTVLLYGVNRNDENESVPAVWKIDLKNNAFYLFENPDTSLAKKIISYTYQHRLKYLRFEK